MTSKIIIAAVFFKWVAPDIAATPFMLPEAKVTVRVINETGDPVENAQVLLGFKARNNPLEDVVLHTVTDANGFSTGQGGSDTVVSSEIRKNGYYDGWAHIPVFIQQDKINNRWLPWNQTYQTVLREIGKPTPLIAKRLRKLMTPVIDKPCGYDLEIGDWVTPYGKGKIPDFIFTARREFESWDKFDVSTVITFTNEGDGIQSILLPEEWSHSVFKWPRLAPEMGYEPSITSRFQAIIGSAYHSTATDNQAYFFRVRTVKKGDRIISALYGKIRGGIQLEARETKTVDVAFTYYLNPTSLDRNLEWDTTKNLIPGLKPQETPREP